MRILLLTQFFDPEPAPISGVPLARWLQDRGHSVEVVTAFPNYPGGRIYPGYKLRPYQKDCVGGIPVHRVPLYPSHDTRALHRVGNYATFALSAATIGSLASSKPEAIYVYHPPATIGLPALLWKAFRGTPYLYHVQDLWPESVTSSGMAGPPAARKALDSVIGAWCRAVYRGAGAIAVLSPGFKRLLVQRGVDESKLHVIRNWAPEGLFHPVPRNETLATELVFTGRLNVLYSGNIGYAQNLEVAVKAAARVQDLEGFRLVFVGSGQAEPGLRQLAGELGAQNVRFLGRRPVTEMGPITGLADALLVSLRDLPFFAATIPSKTQVSLAAGKPVLMAARGDAADLVEEAEAGIVVEPGNVDAMADAFRHLYSATSSELQQMGTRGRSYYLKELSLAQGASHLESLLVKIARTR